LELNHSFTNLRFMFKFCSKFIKSGSLIITLVSSANKIIEEFVSTTVHGIADGKSLT
jgi:hypothetical protein